MELFNGRESQIKVVHHLDMISSWTGKECCGQKVFHPVSETKSQASSHCSVKNRLKRNGMSR
jgi:hypothetical protein